MIHRIVTSEGWTESLDGTTLAVLERLGLVRKDGVPVPVIVGGSPEQTAASMTQFWKKA